MNRLTIGSWRPLELLCREAVSALASARIVCETYIGATLRDHLEATK